MTKFFIKKSLFMQTSFKSLFTVSCQRLKNNFPWFTLPVLDVVMSCHHKKKTFAFFCARFKFFPSRALIFTLNSKIIFKYKSCIKIKCRPEKLNSQAPSRGWMNFSFRFSASLAQLLLIFFTVELSMPQRVHEFLCDKISFSSRQPCCACVWGRDTWNAPWDVSEDEKLSSGYLRVLCVGEG